MISRSNYEMFFIDYTEGNLTPEQVAELIIFLEQNPDLKEEFEGFADVKLEPETLVFEKKENLKKSGSLYGSINSTNYEEQFLAYYEGDLNEGEQRNVRDFVNSNRHYADVFDLFKKAMLKPDLGIVYPTKSKLKKSVFEAGKIKRAYYFASAVAASILLILFFRMNFTSSKNEIVEGHKPWNLNKSKIHEPKFINEENPIEENSKVVRKPEKLVKYYDRIKKDITNTVESDSINEVTIQPLNLAVISMGIDNEEREIIKPTSMPTSFFEITENQPALNNEEEFIQIKDFALRSIKKKLNPKEENTKTGNKITFWDFAQVGVNSVSKITGRKIKLNHSTDDKGNMAQLALVTEKFEFERKLK